MLAPQTDQTLSNIWDKRASRSRRTSPVIERMLQRIPKSDLGMDVRDWIIDNQARRHSVHTIRNYLTSLLLFTEYLRDEHSIEKVTDIRATHVRLYMIRLDDQGHNEGGVHNLMRPIKTFLRWYRREYHPRDWPDPLENIVLGTPKIVPLRAMTKEDIETLVAGCTEHTLTDDRDRAILLALFDTGCRASEFCSIDIKDVDLAGGSILVRWAKGARFRTVFLGHKARAEIARYLRHRNRPDPSEPLWIDVLRYKGGRVKRLTYNGLRQIIRRRAEAVGMPEPGLHPFRRGFALECIRQGIDLESLRRLMGHSDLTVLERYLPMTNDDLRMAHAKASPVDSIYE